MSWYLQRLPPGPSQSDSPPASRESPLECSPLGEGLKICWRVDPGNLAAQVELTSAEGARTQAQLTTVRPIADLTIPGRALKVELLAALDVLEHVVYLRGWVARQGRREKVARVLG